VQRDERGKDVWRADRAAGGVARASLVRPSLRASAVEIEQLVLSELLQKQSGAGASAKANSIAPKFECLIESVCTVLTAGACVCVCVYLCMRICTVADWSLTCQTTNGVVTKSVSRACTEVDVRAMICVSFTSQFCR
jgi:hypothetical protein